jgi:hypothetical protein
MSRVKAQSVVTGRKKARGICKEKEKEKKGKKKRLVRNTLKR